MQSSRIFYCFQPYPSQCIPKHCISGCCLFLLEDYRFYVATLYATMSSAVIYNKRKLLEKKVHIFFVFVCLCASLLVLEKFWLRLWTESTARMHVFQLHTDETLQTVFRALSFATRPQWGSFFHQIPRAAVTIGFQSSYTSHIHGKPMEIPTESSYPNKWRTGYRTTSATVEDCRQCWVS